MGKGKNSITSNKQMLQYMCHTPTQHSIALFIMMGTWLVGFAEMYLREPNAYNMTSNTLQAGFVCITFTKSSAVDMSMAATIKSYENLQ